MDKNPCQSLMLPHENPDLVAKRGKNFCGNNASHLGDQIKQLPRVAEQLLALRAAELVRRHGADEAVADGARMLFLDLLAAVGQHGT